MNHALRDLLRATCAIACAATAWAADPPPAAPLPIGEATRQWLALQRNGTAASPLPMRGADAARAWARYQKSFDAPFPVTRVEDGRTSGK
ncbi:DUF3613 domain-containing protein [Chitiniphilus eburneus]|uniref:DUF3613 domain-containing protein n=1 Tax=Chitiniphilus eburneus TaxID=2571148 RepID=UPI0035D0D190